MILILCAGRVAHLEEENSDLRTQLRQCLLQNEKNEDDLDRISDAVDSTINKCKVWPRLVLNFRGVRLGLISL